MLRANRIQDKVRHDKSLFSVFVIPGLTRNPEVRNATC